MTCVVDANPIEPAMITVQRQLSQHSTSPSWTTLANEFYSAARHTDEKQTWKTTVNSLDTVPDGLYRCSVVNGIGKEVYSEGKRMRVLDIEHEYCSDQLPSLTCDVFEGDPYRWMFSCKSGPSNPPYLTKIDNVNITTNFHVSLFENSIYNYKGFITDASYEKLYVKDRVTENISCCIQNRYCTPICNSCLTTVQKAQRLLKREDYYLIAPGIVLLLVCGGLFFAFSTWMRKRRHQHSYDPTTGPTLSHTVPMDIFNSNVSNDEVDSVHSGLGSGLNDPFRKHSYVTCVDSASVISAPVSRDAYMNIDDQFSDQRSMEDTASVISKKLLYLKNRKLSIDSWGTGQVDYTRRIRSHPRSTTPRDVRTLDINSARGVRCNADGLVHSTLSREDVHASHRSIASTVMGISKSNIVGEISVEHLQIGDLLVKLGDVCWFKASVTDENVQVVIKSVSENATLRVAKHKTEELNELQKIGPHPNVLNLYGWNTASVPNLIIFRLPTNQTTLNSYLRYHYDAMQMREMEQYDVMTSKTAVTCSLDVCRGMAFLSSNGFIHPCLNTHQVLVDFSHVCKLFAFTKASSVSPVNLSPEEEKLHEKWLPPEYLTLKEYCPASDVWSFGVLLWEIFSYGEQPNYRNSVIDGSYLTGVNDLRQPGMCPTEIYHLMISCWNELPVDRPSFHRLQESLEHAYRTLIGNLVY